MTNIINKPLSSLSVFGLGQFGFAMTSIFSDKNPSVPVIAYDPVLVRKYKIFNFQN